MPKKTKRKKTKTRRTANRHRCDRCGAMLTNINRHLRTCNGSITQNRNASAANLRLQQKNITKLKPVVRSRLSTGPTELSAAERAVTPVEIHPPRPLQIALGTQPNVPGASSQEICKIISDIAGDSINNKVFVVKKYRSSSTVEEEEKATWANSLLATTRVQLQTYVTTYTGKDFGHQYSFCEMHDDPGAFRRAQLLAPIPSEYRDVIVPDRLIVVVSAGGVMLKSHADPTGGLLILARGFGAHGEVIFGDQLSYQEHLNPFVEKYISGTVDNKGCAWKDVASLMYDGDTVHIPVLVPHAVHWGGLRLCIGYFTHM